jgi:hypothetical protein
VAPFKLLPLQPIRYSFIFAHLAHETLRGFAKWNYLQKFVDEQPARGAMTFPTDNVEPYAIRLYKLE